jgi:hypothetical protein
MLAPVCCGRVTHTGHTLDILTAPAFRRGFSLSAASNLSRCGATTSQGRVSAGRKRDGCQPLFWSRRYRVVGDIRQLGAHHVCGLDDVGRPRGRCLLLGHHSSVNVRLTLSSGGWSSAPRQPHSLATVTLHSRIPKEWCNGAERRLRIMLTIQSRRSVLNDPSPPHPDEIGARRLLRPLDSGIMTSHWTGKARCNGAAASDRLGG